MKRLFAWLRRQMFPAPIWEYDVLSDTQSLDAAGLQGWELVAIHEFRGQLLFHIKRDRSLLK